MIKLAFTCAAVCAMQYAAMAATGAPEGRSDLPATVSSAFSRQYPQATITDVDIKGDNYFVNFVEKDTWSLACYSPEGTWLRTDTRLDSKDQLPAAVRKGLDRSRFAGLSIDNIEKVQEGSNRTFYFVQVEYGAGHFDNFVNGYVLYFGTNGALRSSFGHGA